MNSHLCAKFSPWTTYCKASLLLRSTPSLSQTDVEQWDDPCGIISKSLDEWLRTRRLVLFWNLVKFGVNASFTVLHVSLCVRRPHRSCRAITVCDVEVTWLMSSQKPITSWCAIARKRFWSHNNVISMSNFTFISGSRSQLWDDKNILPLSWEMIDGGMNCEGGVTAAGSRPRL